MDEHFSLPFATKSAAFVAIILAILISALVFSGVVSIGSFTPSFLKNDPARILMRTFEPSSDLSEEARAIAIQNYETLLATLEEYPTHIAAWLDLAILYKTVGDIEGAMEVWRFLEREYSNAVAMQNMATTYHLEFREYEKAEKYFRKALDAEPSNTSAYIGLHELYRYSYKKDSSAAVDIIKEGLENVPNNEHINLYLMLAGYYMERGDKKDAISAFQEARSIAVSLGDPTLIHQIDDGIASMSR